VPEPEQGDARAEPGECVTFLVDQRQQWLHGGNIMKKISDRVSYLKGLAEGLKLNTEKDSNKVLLEMLDILADAADELERLDGKAEKLENHVAELEKDVTDRLDDLDDKVAELDEYVESIDDDLADLEETLCDGLDEDDEDDDEEDEESDDIIAYECPSCGHEIEFHASDMDFDEDYRCPACGKPVFPQLQEDEEDDDPDTDDAE